MFHCIWHPTAGEQVVETDEFNKRLASGLWFKTQREAQSSKSNEETTHGTNKQRHDLQSALTETRNDGQQTIDTQRNDEDRRDDDQHGSTRASICSDVDQGTRPRISRQVKKGKLTDEPGRANNE